MDKYLTEVEQDTSSIVIKKQYYNHSSVGLILYKAIRLVDKINHFLFVKQTNKFEVRKLKTNLKKEVLNAKAQQLQKKSKQYFN